MIIYQVKKRKVSVSDGGPVQKKTRWGRDMLYERSDDTEDYDDEDDLCTSRSTVKRTCVGGAGAMPLFSSKSGPSSSCTNSAGRTTWSSELSGSGLTRRGKFGGFNPLGPPQQARPPPGPALIPAEEEGVEEVDEATGCPVVDSWLVDDLGEHAAATMRKKKARDSSVEREFRALIGSSCGGGGGRGGRGGGGVRQSRGSRHVRSQRPRHFSSSSSSCRIYESGHKEERALTVENGGVACGDGAVERLDTAAAGRGGGACVISSDSDTEEDFKEWTKRQQRNVVNSHTNQVHSLTTSTAPPLPPPLRIKVRIEGSAYLIPCPLKVDSGKDTTIGWLATQASERYFSQKGKRPVLELTTADGASLCPADPIAHVLEQGQEVVGVVETWSCPPLMERYQIACKNAGVGKCCNYVGCSY